MFMTTFSSSDIKPQNASTWMRQKAPLLMWKVVLPLAVLVLLFIFDYPLRAIVRDNQSPFLTHFYDIIKYAGNVIVGFILAFILIGVGKFAYKDRLLRAGKIMLLSLILTNIIVLIAKPALNIHHRNEFVPTHEQNSDASRWGRFPSGDSTVVFTIAASLSAEFPPLVIPLYALGCLVGVERVYFNLHFFSDIFAGGWLSIAIVAFLRKKYFCN